MRGDKGGTEKPMVLSIRNSLPLLHIQLPQQLLPLHNLLNPPPHKHPITSFLSFPKFNISDVQTAFGVLLKDFSSSFGNIDYSTVIGARFGRVGEEFVQFCD